MKPKTPIETFMLAARDCALLMISNAQYIENELPNVRLADGLETQVRALCAALTATKHDVVSELFELAELKSKGAPPEALARRVQRILEWLAETIETLHAAVKALQAAAKSDFRLGLAYMLVAESGLHILTAFKQTTQAAAAV